MTLAVARSRSVTPAVEVRQHEIAGVVHGRHEPLAGGFGLRILERYIALVGGDTGGAVVA